MKLPTYADKPAHPAQAVLDNTDLIAISLGSSGTGVVSGCLVSPQSVPLMTVHVASGQIAINGVVYSISAQDININSATTGDRRDIIYAWLSGGTIAFGYLEGTTSVGSNWQYGDTPTPPLKPTAPANAALLAEIYVIGGAIHTTAITSDEIVDKRVIVVSSSLPPISPSPEGTYGDSTHIPVVTIDATGRVTSVSTASPSDNSKVPTTRTITTSAPLTGGGDLSADRTFSLATTSNLTVSGSQLDLANTGTAGTYGSDASKTLTVVVDAKGRVTSISATSIAIAQSQVSGLGTALSGKVAVDGSSTMTGDLDLGTHRVKAVANATANSDAPNYGQAKAFSIAMAIGLG